MKVYFDFPTPQEHPRLGLLKPGENDLEDTDALRDAIKAGLLKASEGKPSRPEKKEKE